MKLSQIASMTLAAAATLWVSDGAGATPCPAFPYKDGKFEYARDAKNCVVKSMEGGKPGSRVPTIYNVYCPGRMSAADAKRVAENMGRGKLKPGGRDIRVDFRKVDMSPDAAPNPVAHRFEYACTRNGAPTVATHVKLKFTWNPGQPSAEHHARFCKESGAQSGSVVVGKRMDRAYKCDVYFWGSERAKAQETARLLLTRDLQAQAQAKNAKVCLLASTDIQCAPCTSTNKLVMRVETVKKGALCPVGTIASVE